MEGALRRRWTRLANKAARLTNHVGERRARTSTHEAISLHDLDVPADNRVWHNPSHWYAARRALRRLRARRHDLLVDFGSGLGRVLVVAASLPIGRVVGVEMSAELVERSRRNVAASRGRRRAGSIEVVHADALAYEIPDDLTIAYLYCPFTGPVFADVLGRLLESVERRPRVLRMVYNYPYEHDLVIGSGRAEVLDVGPRHWPPRPHAPDDVIVTYLLLPPGGRAGLGVRAPRPRRSVARHPEWLGPYDPGFSLEPPTPRR